MIEQGRVAGIQLGLTSEDLVALGLQPSASLLTSEAVTDGRCSSGKQWPSAQFAGRADTPRIACSTRARPLHTPLDEESKKNLLLELASHVHARSSVASQQSTLPTWDQVACSVVWKQIVTISNLAIGGESDCVPNEAGRISQLW